MQRSGAELSRLRRVNVTRRRQIDLAVLRHRANEDPDLVDRLRSAQCKSDAVEVAMDLLHHSRRGPERAAARQRLAEAWRELDEAWQGLDGRVLSRLSLAERGRSRAGAGQGA